MHLYSSYSDEQLLSLIQNSDETAFTVLYDRYWEKLLAGAILRLKSTETAEEAVQDVFIHLWNRRRTIAIRHTFHTYISAALKYEIIKKLAERKKIRFEAIDPAGDKSILTMADYSTQHQLDFEDLQQRLEASVGRLPEKCQLVFRLSREEGLSEKQIAETLQISPKTVQGHITHAIRKLRSSLNGVFSIFI